ncbi:MAG: pirin family protein [Elusimicrobia bacterium]|nr:pirin family protein [Elusimicrobiota bacterium]
MGKPRKIETVWKSQPTIEGAGVHLRRAFGFHEVPRLDPFLLLDDFKNDDPALFLPGFPWHPHRGIETITYVLQGEVEHGDSMGNKGVIRPGDVQWMTAGSGIIHQEMPKGDPKGRQWGFQLWANLPRSHKMMDPRYREVLAAAIPEARLAGGARVKVICGEADHAVGPVQDIVTQPQYLDVSVPAQSSFRHPVRAGHTVFAYVFEGKAYFDAERDAYAHEMSGSGWSDVQRECMPGPRNLVLYGRKGDFVEVRTEAEGVRFLLVSGRPIGEPVAWYGPIVMNTGAELKTAFAEYEQGTFIKHVQPSAS